MQSLTSLRHVLRQAKISGVAGILPQASLGALETALSISPCRSPWSSMSYADTRQGLAYGKSALHSATIPSCFSADGAQSSYLGHSTVEKATSLTANCHRPFMYPMGRLYSTQAKPLQPPRAALSRYIIYRGPWLLPFRMLVRMKVIQLSWIAALALPVWTIVSEVSCAPKALSTSCTALHVPNEKGT